MQHELEAKFIKINKSDIRQKLETAGYTLHIPERLMRRVTLDIDRSKTYTKYCRVRDEGNKVTMTYKNIASTENIDGTKEVELIVDSFDNALSFLRQLGAHNECYQENTREEWRKGDVEIMIDHWPATHPFIEVEAPSEELVKSASAELGFDYNQALFGTVVEVYEAEKALTVEQIKELDKLTFETHGKVE